MTRNTPAPATQSHVAIIGSGFGGLGMTHYLKQAGFDDITVFEKAASLGGTWRENTYPGAGCDVASNFYCFSFEPHYPWQWRYGKQAEILEYMHHCARKYDLERHIKYQTEVRHASFDKTAGLWRLEMTDGSRHEAKFVVSAVGQLNQPSFPNIPGIDSFDGPSFHSAQWDHSVDLSGKTVAVVGTGASAVQFVPEIAKTAERLHVFQRNPGWTIPKVERPYGKVERKLMDAATWIPDLDRKRLYHFTEFVGRAYAGQAWAETLVTALAKHQLRKQVKDTDLRAKLTPTYSIGCKRILLSNDWLPTLASDVVNLVTDSITAVTPGGVQTADGTVHAADVIIYGTGFAATDFLTPMTVTGLDGQDLHDTWRDGAFAHLGMSISGFPNFSVLYGPNTNVGAGSIIFMLECQQRYITQLITDQRARDWAYADIKAPVVEAFAKEMQTRSESTTYAGDCQSWYKTADGRNTNTWVGLQKEFAQRTEKIDLANFKLAGVAS